MNKKFKITADNKFEAEAVRRKVLIACPDGRTDCAVAHYRILPVSGEQWLARLTQQEKNLAEWRIREHFPKTVKQEQINERTENKHN